MTTGIYIRVSKDLADCLIDDEFRYAGPARGVESTLADSANLVTVLVGSHEIALFVRHLWAAARRREPASESGSAVIIEHDGRRVAITLEQEGFGDDGPSEKVVQSMTALLQALSKSDS
jgi:hypothetical protein